MTVQKIPFHHGLFYHAMIGYMGRKPDDSHRYGYDGYYEYRYKPGEGEDPKKYYEHAAMLAEWLDMFDIIFSGSRCEYGIPYPPQKGDEAVLQVRIKHFVKREEK